MPDGEEDLEQPNHTWQHVGLRKQDSLLIDWRRIYRHVFLYNDSSITIPPAKVDTLLKAASEHVELGIKENLLRMRTL